MKFVRYIFSIHVSFKILNAKNEMKIEKHRE